MPEQVNNVPEKWAVLIGIEYYQHPEQPATTPRHDSLGNEIQYKSLLGCVNDILAVEQYLIDTVKVDPKNITKLLAPFPGRRYLSELLVDSYRDPTYDNMVSALQDVCKSARKGDFIYIHFSGHGARATTVFPVLKGSVDDIDQALVPSDITCGGKYFRDLEMGILLQAMVDASLIVTVVLDCCYSGSAIRGDDDPELGHIRGISELYMSDPKLDLPRNIDRIFNSWGQMSWMKAPQGFVVLSAGMEYQKAIEMKAEDHSHGLLTHSLLTVLRNSPVDVPSQTLYEQICAKVQSSNRNQTPYLVGDIDRFFFSEKLRSRVNALVVRRAYVDTGKEPIDHQLCLAGGELHGVVAGSEYAILPWGFDLSKRIEEADVLALVRVTRVSTVESIASLSQTDRLRWEKIEEGCPAVLQQVPIVKKSVVHFVTPDNNVRECFKEDWHRHNGNRTWLSLNENNDRDAFLTVTIDESGNFEIRDQSGNYTAAIRNAVQPLPAASPDSIPALICRLEHLARFKMTKELANPGVRPGRPSALVSIKVDPAPQGIMLESGQWLPPAKIIQWMEGAYEVDDMALFRITICNQSSRSLNCVVLNCGAEFGIEQLFPIGMAFYRLRHGETKEVDIAMEVAKELRAAAESVAFEDTLKVLVCNTPMNLDSLRLPSLSDMEKTATRYDASEGSRSLGLDNLLSIFDTSQNGVSPDFGEADWETLDVKIRIRPLSEYMNMAVDATPQTRPYRADYLDDLTSVLGRRFKGTGSIGNLDRAIEIANMAVDVTSQDHPNRAAILNNLTNWLSIRFDQTNFIDDLNRAIEVADMAVEALPQDYSNRADYLSKLGVMLGMRFKRTGSIHDLNRAIYVMSTAVDARPEDYPERAAYLNSLGAWFGMRFNQTGSIDDLNRAIEITSMVIDATPKDHPNRVTWLSNLGAWLSIRFDKTGSMDDLTYAIEVISIVIDVTSEDYPEQVTWLSNLGAWFSIRFDQTGSMDDLNRAIEVTSTVIDITPKDHPDRVTWLSNLGAWLGMRFNQTGSVDDIDLAIKVIDMAVDAAPQEYPNRAAISNLRIKLSMRSERAGSIDDHNRATDVADMTLASRATDVDDTATTMSARDAVFFQKYDLTRSSHTTKEDAERDMEKDLKKGIPHGTKTEQASIWLDQKRRMQVVDTTAENLTSAQLLEKPQRIPAYPNTITGQDIENETKSSEHMNAHSEIKGRLSGTEILHAEVGQTELRTILESISSPSDVRFFVDLNDFNGRLKDRIDSLLVVTGSPKDAFANTVACYVRWRWGRRGMEILNWLSQFLLATRSSRPSSSHQLRINEEDEEAGLVCTELQAQLMDKSTAPLSKCNTIIRVQWIKGGTKKYNDLVADIASQLAWIVAAFKEPPKEGLSFSRTRIENPFSAGDTSQNDEDHCSTFRIVYDDALDQDSEVHKGTCWHQLFTGFNVASGFPIPHRPYGMHGVELPLSLMTTFADVGYPVAYGGGHVLKGWKNALFPIQTDSDSDTIDEASAVQWHLFQSERPRLYMAEVKSREPALLPKKIGKSPIEFLRAIETRRRHFLGLYKQSTVCAGTDKNQAWLIRAAIGQEKVKETKQGALIEWGRTVSLAVGGGGAGMSGGLSTVFRFRTRKERMWHISKSNRSLDEHLSDTSTNLNILYDVQARVAWMVPQICVVMHLLQAYTKATYREAPLKYPDLPDMSLAGLKLAFNDFCTQTPATEAAINLEDHFKDFSNMLCQLQDNPDLKPLKEGITQKSLVGVDFAHLATKPETYSILSTYITLKSSGDWPKVLESNWEDFNEQKPHQIVILFCASLNPQPIMPDVAVCSSWFPLPVDQDYLVTTIYCLRKLADTYKRHADGISREHIWERGSYGPYDDCGGRGCNRLQKIVSYKKWNRNKSMLSLLQESPIHASVVFGGEFCMTFRQTACGLRSPP